MITLKRHKIADTVFFILFFIYVISPLTTPLKESKRYLAENETFKSKDVAIFFVDFLYAFAIEDDDKESSQPEDENVLVKKKRAVISKFDKTTIAKAAHISHIVSVELFTFSEQPHIKIAFTDHDISPKPLKDFRPLFSGVSPPIA